MGPTAVQDQLRTRYTADFTNYWREYLKRASVAKYANIADATRKLGKTSRAQSPLPELFWLASQNTAVDDPMIQPGSTCPARHLAWARPARRSSLG
jgi:type VI protein secretion system component VasK